MTWTRERLVPDDLSPAGRAALLKLRTSFKPVRANSSAYTLTGLMELRERGLARFNEGSRRWELVKPSAP